MDITIDVEDYRLNVRAAGIIIHNNKVLLHKCEKNDYYALVGGRVKILEASDDTVKREIKEELGKEVEVTGYVATVENFFEHKGVKYHEILFAHKAEFINEDDKKIECEMKNIEGREDLNYVWIDLNKIDEYNIKPQAIKNVLKERKFPSHVINNDIK